jgi:hypothetical protein
LQRPSAGGIQATPSLLPSSASEQQRHVVAAIRTWNAQAPAGQRARIEHDARVIRPRGRRRTVLAAAGITAGLAIAALLALLVVPSTLPGRPLSRPRV